MPPFDRTPFTGRQAELTALLDQLAAARRGQGTDPRGLLCAIHRRLKPDGI